jgi:hypothetical protein
LEMSKSIMFRWWLEEEMATERIVGIHSYVRLEYMRQ